MRYLRSKSERLLQAAIIIAFAQCGVSESLPTAWQSGIATNFGGGRDGKDPWSPSFGTLSGGCGYGLLDKSKFPYWSVGALSMKSSFFLDGPVKGCGECFEIQCINDDSEFKGRCNTDSNARSVTVMITDHCPECEANQFDIQALTFNKMAPMDNGRVRVKFRRVQCTPPSALTIVVDANAGSGGTLRLTVQQTGNLGSIQLVQVEGQAGGWQNMRNSWGAAWEIAQQPQPPLDLRVRDSNGVEVTAFGIIGSNGQKGTIPTGVQFKFDATPGAVILPIDSAVTAFEGPPLNSSFSSPYPPSGSLQQPPSPGNSPQAPPPGSPPPPPPPGSQFSGPQPPPTWPMPSPPPPPQGWQKPPPPPPPTQQPPPPPPPPSAPSGCSDIAPNVNGAGSCAQQKLWGQCSQGWITQASNYAPKGFCAQTCGRC